MYFKNTDPDPDIRTKKLRYVDSDSVWTDSRFYYPDLDPGILDILFLERIRSGFRIESGSRMIIKSEAYY